MLSSEEVTQIISAVDLKTTFTDDAVEVLRLAANEYVQEVFGEMLDAKTKRREQIDAVEERLRVLRAEMEKLEDEKRTLEKHPCHAMNVECLMKAVERVDEKGRTKLKRHDEMKRKREEALFARRPKPGKG
jgi:predicted ribosome quality control (RQC) complex YloA/Tae2 family protein